MRDFKEYLIKKNKFDFSLIPIGILLLEISIISGNYSQYKNANLENLLVMSFVHTSVITVLLLIYRSYLRKNLVNKANYFSLSMIGFVVAIIASTIYLGLGRYLNENVMPFGTNLFVDFIQGCFWFPNILILGGKRQDIIRSISRYEERLIIQTRKSVRNSEDFANIKNKVTQNIYQELLKICSGLIEKIEALQGNQDNPFQKVDKFEKILAGNELRKFSMKLEESGKKTDEQSYVKQAIYSIKLFSRQYSLLYWQTLKNNPLPISVYPLVLITSLLPSMVRFLPLNQFLFVFTSLLTLSYALTFAHHKVIKSSKDHTLRISSFLVLLIGLTPALTQFIGDYLFPNDRRDYPLISILFFVPIGYLIIMRVIQLIQESTITFIESGNLIVSQGLKQAISKVIEVEFVQTLSHTWAMHVHGKILTRLSATALRLKQAELSNDSNTITGSLAALIELLKNPALEINEDNRNCLSEVKSRLTPWEGLVEIEYEIDPALLETKCSRMKDLGEVIEEAISNSVRHGKSSKLSLKLRNMDNSEVHITLTDDSNYKVPELQTRFGLGTKLFNLISDGRWRLQNIDSGTQFSLTMSLEEVQK